VAQLISLAEAPLRRRAQIRFAHSNPREWRKRGADGFDVAAPLELNLERCPTKPGLLDRVRFRLAAAEREALVRHHAKYVSTLKRAAVLVSDAPTIAQAFVAIRTSGSAY
jgi:hypothetical protein